MSSSPPRRLCFAIVCCVCMCSGVRTQVRAGDFDGNTVIENSDRAVFQRILLGQETDPAYVALADINHDGVVDGRDIGPFSRMLQLGGPDAAGGAPGAQRGACCISTPGAFAICVVIPEHACDNAGGTFMGAGTRCTDPNIGCPITPPPPVACCLPNGDCVNAPPIECIQMMGVPQGPFTTCADNACMTPPPVGACCVS
ncbi:MAG: dockerin type I repeat-containing protein, partial [Phycisphaerales bacterium]|nr:dockerin type I repeat-containing protein [Phycisphaerales bacterium]